MRVAFAIVAVCLCAHAATAQPHEPTVQQKDEARNHFELGLAHFDRQEWGAALVEFLKSHELYATRGNTKDAAICLRKVGRFDESLDMYEALVRDFSDLTPSDRELATREIAELQASVGMVEITGAPAGAAVTIDGSDRGTAPTKPLRLSAGPHIVRVTKEGSLPFEQRVDLVGRQTATIRVQLAALTRAGRLQVAEHTGKSLRIIIDGAAVGSTPWEGALAPGAHTVLLAGDDNVGTPPQRTDLAVDKLVTLELTAEALGASLRVDPKPASALVTIDGVPVGRGAWQGRLRIGAHAIDATLEGYARFTRRVAIAEGESSSITATLASLARPGHAGIALELDLGTSVGSYGSDLASACTQACGAFSGFGAGGIVHAIYQRGSGLGFGLHAGYLFLRASVAEQAISIPSGSYTATGTVTDELTPRGFLAGIDGQYRTAGTWPLTFRLGLGALIGSVRDHRTGDFTAGKDGSAFSIDVTQDPGLAYLDIAPAIHIGRRFGEHIEVALGVDLHILANLTKIPHWDKTELIDTHADGAGTFTDATLMRKVQLVFMPGLGAHYEF